MTDAFVTGPGNAEDGLYFGEQEVSFAKLRHSSIQSLEEHFPDGTYLFHFGHSRWKCPEFPRHLHKERSGVEVPGPHPDDAASARRSWPTRRPSTRMLTSCVTGPVRTRYSAHPNGVIDDLIFVIMGNCLGVKAVHSGAAFGPSFLTYEAKEFIIPAGSLRRPTLPGRVRILRDGHGQAGWPGLHHHVRRLHLPGYSNDRDQRG